MLRKHGVLTQFARGCAQIILVSMLAGCASTASRHERPIQIVPLQEFSSTELEIAEAVFRYQFKHNAAYDEHGTQPSKIKIYFLSLGTTRSDPEKEALGESFAGYDPPDTFISRFQGSSPRVDKVSKSERNSDWSHIIDRETGELGILFYVSTIRVTSSTTATVYGGYVEEVLNSSGNKYAVRLIDGKWTVEHDELDWIS